MRLAVLSNPSGEASRSNHPLPIYPYPQPGCAIPDRSTRLSNKIIPTKSSLPANWDSSEESGLLL